jgi:hypothetical protein
MRLTMAAMFEDETSAGILLVKNPGPKNQALVCPQRGSWIKNKGVLEYWSNGKSISGHIRVVKMSCTRHTEFVFAQSLSPRK